MSHSFYIRDIPDLSYQEITNQLAIDNLVVADDVALPEDGSWPQGTIYLYIDNVSVRPLEINYENNELQVRIFQASCVEDYQLAQNLSKTVANQYDRKIHPEDSGELSIPEFDAHYGQEWAERHSKAMLDMLIDMYQREKQVLTIGGTRRELRAGPRFMDALLKNRDEFSVNFFNRFRMLQYIDRDDNVFPANVMAMNLQDDNKQVRFSVWTESVPTLVSLNVDAITMQGYENEEQNLFLTPESVLLLLADEATLLSEDWCLLPGITGNEWDRVYTAAQAYQVNDLAEIAREVSEDDAVSAPSRNGSLKEHVTAEEWQLLSNAPALVFLAVASADGNVDKKEKESFARLMQEIATTGSGLLQDIVVNGNMDFIGILQGMAEQSLDLPQQIHEIGKIVDRHCGKDEAFNFKMALWGMGKEVAQASGGGMLGLGKKISKEEETVLAGIGVVLGITG